MRGLLAIAAIVALCSMLSCTPSDDGPMVLATEHPPWLKASGLGAAGELLFCERERGIPRGTVVVKNDGPDTAHVRVWDQTLRELDIARGEARNVDAEGTADGSTEKLDVSGWWPVPPRHYEADFVRNVSVPIRRMLDPALITVAPKRTKVFGRRQPIEVMIENRGTTTTELSFEIDGPFAKVEPANPSLEQISTMRVELRLESGPPGDVTGALRIFAPSCDAPEPRLLATVPLEAKRGARVLELASGAGHTCARLAGDTVSCFGADDVGQLGRDPASLPGAHSRSALAVPGLANVARIAAGRAHTCVLSAGSVWCWGDGAKGQCGPSASGTVVTPVKVALPTSAVSIYAGVDTTCATLANQSLVCWGVDIAGTPNVAPTSVNAISNPKSVAIGAGHICALDQVGETWCWGAGGRIGDGTDQPSAQPKAVTLTPTFVALAAGDTFTCGIGPTGALDCWGSLVIRGKSGQRNSPTRVIRPPLVGTMGTPKPMLSASGNKYCWFDTELNCDGFFKTLVFAKALEAISVAGAHYCLLDDGGVRCDTTVFGGQQNDVADHDENGLLIGLQGD